MGTVRYTVIDGEVIAEKRNGVRKLYVPDPLGSTVALLDNTQAQTDTFSYWPYGEDAGSVGSTPTPFQFVGTLGYYHDSSTKTYVRIRDLKVITARWIEQDRQVRSQAYVYAYNNPLTFTDVSGNIPDKQQSGPSKKPSLSKEEATDCQAVSENCLAYVFAHAFREPNRQNCFSQNSNWIKQLAQCACTGGANPLLMLAIAWQESNWGTIGYPHTDPRRCANPFSYHFNELGDSLGKLCYPNGTLPTFQQSACKTAQLVHSYGGVSPIPQKPGKKPYGDPDLIIGHYRKFKNLCSDVGIDYPGTR